MVDPLSDAADKKPAVSSSAGPMSSYQGIGGPGMNAVPLKAQVPGNIGPMNENEGCDVDLYAGPEGLAGPTSTTSGKNSKHYIG